MGEEPDPIILTLLAQYPHFFKLPDYPLGQEPSSRAQASIAQLEASRKVVTNKMGRKGREGAVEGDTDGVEQNMSDKLLLAGFIEAAAADRSEESKVEPERTTIAELADEYNNSPGKEERQTLSDMLLESAAIHNKSANRRSISPPLGYARTYRDTIRSHQQLGSSPLRNEIYRASADDDGVEQNKGKVSYLGINLLNQPFVPQGRVIESRDILRIGMSTDAAKVEEPAARAHSTTMAKDQEGATEETTVQEGSKRIGRAHTTLTKGAVAYDGSLIPPVNTVSKGFRRYPKIILKVPAPTSGESPPTECSFGDSGIESHTGERSRVANESDDNGQGAVVRDTDLGYDQAVCDTVLGYSQTCEADKVLDCTDELLVKLAEYIDAANIKIRGTITRKTTFPRMSAEFLRMQLLNEVIRETHKSHADPSYKETTAREKFAVSKGVNFDSHLVERIDGLVAEIDKELLNPHSSFATATDHNNKKDILLEQMALLELKVFGKSKNEESQLAIEAQVTGRVKNMESDVHVAGSAISPGKGEHNGTSKGKGKESKLVLDDVANGKGKAKDDDMLGEGSNVDSGKEMQSEPLMGGPKTKKRKAKSKKSKSSSGAAVTAKGTSKEHDMLVEGSTLEEGEGKECAATEKGKAKENDLPPAESKVESKKNNHEAPMNLEWNVELVDEARAVVLGPESNKSTTGASFTITFSSDLPASSAIFQDPRVIEAQNQVLKALEKMYDVMELVIRPQSASPYQLDLFCRFVRDPDYFSLMSSVIEELRWNRAVVEHPHNSMVTTVLQYTAHLRPTDGLHHSSGISVAPVLLHQHPAFPPGLGPFTPAATTPTEKRENKERPGDIRLKQALKEKKKPPLEDPLQVLDHKQAVLESKMKIGPSQPTADVLADMMTTADSRRQLKEKARLEEAGGKIADRLADRLAQRLKMDEEDEVPPYLLP